MNYPALFNRFNGSAWAITAAKLDEIKTFISARVNGVAALDMGERDMKEPPIAARSGGVGVLSIFGTISQRVSMMDRASGGVSTEQIKREFDSMLADRSIGSIVLNIDSPGGGVQGLPELADHIFNSRGQKRIFAVANSLAASAAYWLGTAANEFYATPSGEVGSIGVFLVHTDLSAMDEQAGVKFTIISAGKFKMEGNDMEPLSAEARDEFQRVVDHYYSMFVKAVAQHRGVATSAVVKGYGEGRVLVAPQAFDAGMIDGVKTFDWVLDRAANASRRFRAPSAALQRERMELT